MSNSDESIKLVVEYLNEVKDPTLGNVNKSYQISLLVLDYICKPPAPHSMSTETTAQEMILEKKHRFDFTAGPPLNYSPNNYHRVLLSIPKSTAHVDETEVIITCVFTLSNPQLKGSVTIKFSDARPTIPTLKDKHTTYEV